MQKSAHRAAAKMEHPGLAPEAHRFRWDDLRIFLACVEHTSFRQAAHELCVSSSTVVRRIERLETVLKVRLFDRVPEGVLLTADGRMILERVRGVERRIYDVWRNRPQPNVTARGAVSMSITEGLGAYWLVPQLVEFQRSHPFIVLSLRCAMESVDVLRMEADMAIQFQRPTNPELMVAKLGRLHIYLFVAQSYVDIYGMPKSIEEMREHRLVDQWAPNLDQGAWARYLGLDNIEGVVGLRTNSSTALLYAVEKGAGIGALPTYALALKAPVIPVDVGIRHHMDIWLTYHPDMRKTPRFATVIDWVKEAFSPARYPWFRDEFIHPRDLVELASAETDTHFGEGFFAANPFQG